MAEVKVLRWEVGDEVVSLITSTADTQQPLLEGSIYTVKAVMYCQKDGMQKINVGFQSSGNIFSCDCGQTHPSFGLKWTSATRFKSAKKEDDLDSAVDKLKEELKK